MNLILFRRHPVSITMDASKGGRGTISGLVFLTFLFLVGFLLVVMGIPEKLYPRLIVYPSAELRTLFYLPLGSLVSVLFFLKRKKRASFMALVVTFGFFYLHLSLILLKFNPERSMKTFSERILRRTGPEEELKWLFSGSTDCFTTLKSPLLKR
jgi:hypothetical protein